MMIVTLFMYLLNTVNRLKRKFFHVVLIQESWCSSVTMQAVKVSCLAQTFALAKISNSRERKPRSRKTREERKVMVESFVKK